MATRQPLAERFARHVGPPTETGCRLWQGGIQRNGYGKFGDWATGRTLMAHRVAYVLAYGPIPTGLQVLHSCDTPSCVEPAHLRAGTQKENLAEMRAKDRYMTPKRVEAYRSIGPKMSAAIRAANARKRNAA